ncbi:DUF1611 domain-containing protein [Gloeocapsa sp. PCC 73106]|uniref:DUF1611 domain-containing protein n=1 Tax=Gloeocapsa sp. PCC 73106 TaxID=102232 RepID=UPI0002ACB15B|nr:DUF1611 domain-containing protein [Gloeocapsa sp. PCC 73106]ELR97012.1 hypothetical protein GLO73106DRAFT_00008150 [Gloeocapsa sp. PCC 73106]
MRIRAEHRVAILLHEGIMSGYGKTGLAYLRYGLASVVAIIDSQTAGQSLSALTGIDRNIPIVADVKAALTYGPEILIIGIAPSGGSLPESWQQEITSAIQAGLSIANGLHTPLGTGVDNLQPHQWIWDIRQAPENIPIGKGRAGLLSGERILTVGTDMGVGKMSVGLELHRYAQKKGINSQFLATGQGGMMIAGTGIPLDAIKVDFAAGAVEQMVLAAKDYPWLIIEGQGSLLHPGSTATLPLIRGSQPTALILVHRAGQTNIRDVPEVLIPPLPEVIKLYEMVASVSRTTHSPKVQAIALNTASLDYAEAQRAIDTVAQATNLPCNDVVRFGADIILQVLQNYPKLL